MRLFKIWWHWLWSKLWWTPLDLWGTLDSIAEGLGNSMAVVSHFQAGKILGKTTINNSLALSGNYSETVSTLLLSNPLYVMAFCSLFQIGGKADRER